MKYESTLSSLSTHSIRLVHEFDPIATGICIFLQYSSSGISAGSDSSHSSKSVFCVSQMCAWIAGGSSSILYFSLRIAESCTSDFVHHFHDSNSSSPRERLFVWNNWVNECFTIPSVWAITPSKSKSIAQKGFILFSYTLDYAPLCSRFIPSKSSKEDHNRNLEIKSQYHEYDGQNRAPGDSFFADITGSAHGMNSRKYLTDSPADSIAAEEEEK